MGRILDENGRLFGVINIIDALVVLVVLAVAGAGLGLVWGPNGEATGGGPESGTNSSAESVTVTVRATSVQPYVADAVPVSGPIEDGNISRLENVSISPAEVVVTDDSGELHVRDHPRLKRVELRVVLNATRTDGELRFDGRRVRIGQELTLDLGAVSLGGKITRIHDSE